MHRPNRVAPEGALRSANAPYGMHSSWMLAMPRRNFLVLLIAVLGSWLCYQRAARNRYAATLTEAMNIVTASYIHDVEPRVLFEGAMDGMIGKLDPYSAYTSPEEFNQFQQQMEGEFTGVGIVVDPDEKNGRLTVLDALIGKPAYLAGIRAGRHHPRHRRAGNQGCALARCDPPDSRRAGNESQAPHPASRVARSRSSTRSSGRRFRSKRSWATAAARTASGSSAWPIIRGSASSASSTVSASARPTNSARRWRPSGSPASRSTG